MMDEVKYGKEVIILPRVVRINCEITGYVSVYAMYDKVILLEFQYILKYGKIDSFHYLNTFFDHLFGIVVSTSDCHPRGHGFDSRLYPRNSFLEVRCLERGPLSLVRTIG